MDKTNLRQKTKTETEDTTEEDGNPNLSSVWNSASECDENEWKLLAFLLDRVFLVVHSIFLILILEYFDQKLNVSGVH